MTQITLLQDRIADLRDQLNQHELYSKLTTIEDVKVFMEHHVYAVWDFMSLLKALQQHLTCTTTPWMPGKDATLARFINEIVHGEESDVNEKGEPKSHFDMYLDAMQEVQADTDSVQQFLSAVHADKNIFQTIESANLPNQVKGFLKFTFEVIATNEPHLIASAFTFGREDIIPDMFLSIIEKAEMEKGKAQYPKLKYYLDRHIELDGDEHGPLSLKMIEQLCGNDEQKWQAATQIAVQALEHRIALWDCTAKQISNKAKALDIPIETV